MPVDVIPNMVVVVFLGRARDAERLRSEMSCLTWLRLPVITAASRLKRDCLTDASGVRQLHSCAGSHLCRCSNHEVLGRLPDPQAEVLRRGTRQGHLIRTASAVPDTPGGDVLVPALQLRSRIEPAKVLVSRTVAEPATHLEESVIHLRGSQVVTDAQTLQGQTSQLVSANGDDAYPVWLSKVIEGVLCRPR